MQSLVTLIDLLLKGRRLHVSILDLCGILKGECAIPRHYAIHSRDLCSLAKSTPKGLSLCLGCKALANERAVKEKKPFCGHCPYGIYEAAAPVIINGSTAAVVYVGYAVTDEARSRALASRAAAFADIDSALLSARLSECERVADEGELLSIAEIVGDYIKILSQKADTEEEAGHWLVKKMEWHAQDAYASCTLTLKSLAAIYRKNEKYMGRLFKAERGVSFSDYCNSLRLEQASRMLSETSEKIIDIALCSGFNNVPYFNRVFKEKFGLSPKRFRAERKFDKSKRSC